MALRRRQRDFKGAKVVWSSLARAHGAELARRWPVLGKSRGGVALDKRLEKMRCRAVGMGGRIRLVSEKEKEKGYY